MPSTYTLNNGIELIATGEQSGTWGDTTNTNLSLVDTALDGQVTVTLTTAGTSGSPNTLAISDGAASDGRNRMVIFNDGADLTATAYVQLTPNDAEKIIYVRNDLSGSRSIILFQGTYSASNDYEVPAGTTAVIFFDGAGSGAVAANVFNNAYFDSLRLGSVSVTAILDEDDMSSDSATSLATQQSIKAYVDSQVTAQDLDFGGDSGTGAVDLDSQTFTIAGTANEIETSASGQTLTVGLPDDVTIAGDLTVDTDTLYVDSTNNRVGVGTTSPDSDLHISGTGNEAKIIIEGAANPRGNFIAVEGADDLVFAADEDNLGASSAMKFRVDATERMQIDTSGRLLIGLTSAIAVGSTSSAGLEVASTGVNSWISQTRFNNANSGPLHLFGKSRSATVGTFGTVVQDDDALGTLSWAGDDGTDAVSVAAQIQGAVDGTPGANDMPGRLVFLTTADGAAAPTERMRIDSAGNVGIGAASPSSTFRTSIYGDGSSIIGGVEFRNAAAGGSTFTIGHASATSPSATLNVTTAANLTFKTDDTEAMRIDSSQRVLINSNSSTQIRTRQAVLQSNGTSSDAGASFTRWTNGGGGPYLTFAHSRSATVNGGFTILQADDILGSIDFAGADGTDLTTPGASITALVDGTPGANDMPGRLVFSTTVDGGNGVTERMRIDNAGLVTIGDGGGAITPLRIKKTVSDTIDLDKTYNVAPKGAWLELYNPGGTTGGGVGISALGLGTEGRYAAIAMTDQTSDNSGTGGDIEFWTSASKTGALAERMTVKGSGEVLIGSPYLTNSITPMNLKLSTNGSSGNNLVIGKHVTGAFAPAIAFAASDGTEVSPTQVASGDVLGQINFYGYDTNSYALGGYIRGVVDGAVTDGDMPTRIEFAVSLDGTESPTEAMRIDNARRVIINNGDVSTGTGTNKALLQVANIDTTYDWSDINTAANGYASTANEIAVLNTANQDLNGWAGIFFQAGESSNGSSINAARIGAIKTSTGGTNTDLAFACRNGSGVMKEHLRIDSFGGLTIKSLGGTTAAAFGGTNLVNGITAVPSSAGTPFVVGRDTGTTRSAHFAGNLKFDNGYGIDFDASSGSGRTSSVLDDYEEGTWTPVLKGSSGATKTWTYSAAQGYYTKVGNQVTVWFNIQLSSDGSGTDGNAYIDGLPYTSANLSNLSNNYGFFWKQLIETGDVALQGRNQVNTSTIALQDGSSSYPDISPLNTSVFLNDRRIRGTFTYQA